MNKDQQQIIRRTEAYVKNTLEHAEGGHDWWHVYRVWQLSKRIAEEENVDLFTVELAALLHDIADAKFYDGDEEEGPRRARTFLSAQKVEEPVIVHVTEIIRNISFKNSFGKIAFKSRELDVVQDADRLDAMGAIGIARTFNYGGYKNRALYDPGIPPETDHTKQSYSGSTAPTINHFYEKLLLLKERMNTATGKQMAEERHRFMEAYLQRFFREWDGKV